MSRIPRTPVYFPRMKVRGKRNRAKLAARHHDRHHMPHVTVALDPATGATTFWATTPEKATHAIVLDLGIRDGYGRVIEPAPASRPEPKRPAPTYSMEFTMKADVDELWQALTGSAPP